MLGHRFRHEVLSQPIPPRARELCQPLGHLPLPWAERAVPTLCQGWSPTLPAPTCSGAAPGCPRCPGGLLLPQVPFLGFLQRCLSRRLCPSPAPFLVPMDSSSK